ncbi:MAG: DUF1109 domain-containing protein [Pacificimonas sp.]
MSSDLLDRLAEDASPVRRANAALFIGVYAGGFVLSLLLVIVGMKVRPDLVQAGSSLIFAFKILAPGIVAAAGAILLLRAGQPGRTSIASAGQLAFLGCALFLVPLVTAFIAAPAAEADMMTNTTWMRDCLTGITMATFPTWAAALFWLRKSAPTRLERASWIAGLASAAAGTTAFALHCPYDSFAYVGTWYLAAILGIAALTRLVLPRFIRW